MRIVLTVIAVCLVWICARDVVIVKPAHAQGMTDVNIAAIAGHRFGNFDVEKMDVRLPVRVKNWQ